MVEVFKTNVQEVYEANRLIAMLLDHFPESRISLDLDDCDKVLRVEGGNFSLGKVMMLVKGKGYVCQELE